MKEVKPKIIEVGTSEEITLEEISNFRKEGAKQERKRILKIIDKWFDEKMFDVFPKSDIEGLKKAVGK